MSDTIKCSCGKTLLRRNMARHMESKAHQGQVGEGRILDATKSVLGFAKKTLAKVGIAPRQSYNNTTTRTLGALGDTPIRSLMIIRTPIESWINKAINFVSLGKWNEVKKRFKYDDLFHLALIANVAGRDVVIEKNEVINVGLTYRRTPQTEQRPVPISGKLTINELLNGARRRMGDQKFYEYEGFNNNCQTFIMNILAGAGLMNADRQKFIQQDLSDFVKESEHTKVVADTLTYTAGIANRALGKGRSTPSTCES